MSIIYLFIEPVYRCTNYKGTSKSTQKNLHIRRGNPDYLCKTGSVYKLIPYRIKRKRLYSRKIIILTIIIIIHYTQIYYIHYVVASNDEIGTYTSVHEVS